MSENIGEKELQLGHKEHTAYESSSLNDGPSNVTEIFVTSDLCVGCGVCAAICPTESLSIRLDNNGEFKPILIDTTCKKCKLCLQVCPFYQGSIKIDSVAKSLYGNIRDISYDNNIGYYLSSWVGYSIKHRRRSASGGMTTWLLEELLLKGLIDKVICVVPDNRDGLVSKEAILTSVEEIREAVGSRYHPIELSEVLKTVRNDYEYKYAITGLPCFLYALRLAMSKDRHLSYCIKFLLGLVCGHCPGYFYSEALSLMTGHKLSSCRLLDYRCKEGTDRAGNFRFRVLDHSGKWSKSIPFIGMPSFLWSNMYFSLNSCNFCDDVFAEVADAVFMDAWLPDYSKDRFGTSIIVVRSPEIHDLILNAHVSDECKIEPISIRYVVDSQDGAVYQKKYEIGASIAYSRSMGKWLPPMRVASNDRLYNKVRRSVNLRMSITHSSKKYWIYFRKLHSQSIWPFLIFTWLLQGYNAVYLKNIHRIIPFYRILFCLLKYTQKAIQKLRNLLLTNRL